MQLGRDVAAKFVFDVAERLEKQLAGIGEDGGFARGDAVAGKKDKDSSNDEVNGNAAVETRAGWKEVESELRFGVYLMRVVGAPEAISGVGQAALASRWGNVLATI
jgi:hypothetical protein